MSSALARIFSSKPVRGFYKDEPPEVPLEIQGNRQEKRRLAALVNRIARSSPFGKELLETAAAEGYVVCFELQGMASGGFTAPDEKVIGLNPMKSDSTLVGILAHEARHVRQYQNGMPPGGYDPQYTLETQLLEKRMMEADAVASSLKVAADMETRGDGGPMQALKRRHTHPAAAYENARGGSGAEEEDRAMTAAVLGWFRDETIKFAYEEAYVLYPLSHGRAFENETGVFKSKTPREIVSALCRIEEERNYFSAPTADLSFAEYSGLSSVSAAWMTEHVRACREAGATDALMDPTLLTVRVCESSPFMRRRLENGYVVMPEELAAPGREKLVERMKKTEAGREISPAAVASRKVFQDLKGR